MKMMLLQVVLNFCQTGDGIGLYLDGIRDAHESSKACIVDISKCASLKTEAQYEKCLIGKVKTQMKRLSE